MIKKILIICYSHHYKEPRLLMQCAALGSEFKVTTAGFSSANNPLIDFIPLTKITKQAPINFHQNLPRFLRFPFTLVNKVYLSISRADATFSKADFKLLSRNRFDLVIAHHPETLELALRLKQRFNCKLIFNAHEIYPYEFESDKRWMELNFKPIDERLKRYLHQFDGVLTVNKEIAQFYSSRYSCNAVAIHNSKPFNDTEPTQLKEPIRIIHHGGAMPQRKLEQMADAVLACGNKYELTFMLTNTNEIYLEQLKSKYQPLGVKFSEPVVYHEIVGKLNAFDIGLYILPNDTINHDLALPNKIFEFVQAKLALVTSPNAAMKNLILKYELGIVSKDDSAESMAETLKKLSPKEILHFKSKTKEFSKELSSEKDEERIASIVKGLIMN